MYTCTCGSSVRYFGCIHSHTYMKVDFTNMGPVSGKMLKHFVFFRMCDPATLNKPWLCCCIYGKTMPTMAGN